MKRNSKLALILLSLMLCMAMVFTGCQPSSDDSSKNSTKGSGSTAGGSASASGIGKIEISDLNYPATTTLRMGTGYNKNTTGLTFIAELMPDGQSSITLADGKTYKAGDLKPTWQEVQSKLAFVIDDVYQGKSASDEFDYWKNQLDKVDVVSGTATKLTEAGANGSIVNIADYLDLMPNFKKYLEDNPIVRLSITGSTIGANSGAIYFSPYFDGVDDIERMPLMRVDMAEKLLNGEGAFTATESKNLNAAVYTPFMPTTGTVKVDVVKKDGTGTEKVTKDYSKYGNIVAKMNEKLAKGSVTGVEAVNMLRDYIDQTYGGYYGTKRADLFVGQNAAWDADEMVALLRCVVANSKTINGTDTMYGLFARESSNNQRPVDMFRFAGTLFGARGLESRSDYYYFDKDGNLVDARTQEASYEAIERMNALQKEGLFVADYNVDKATGKSETFLAEDTGFMSYDYNQTQTILNETKLQDGEKYMAIIVPVSKWNDGTGDKYERFTESWRSVKTDGWGISYASAKADPNKLKAALKLIDFAYSEEGQILMSYGPDAFIKVKDANGTTIETKYETFDFNGKQMPVIADATAAELWSLASGNYTNYARRYLGSTLSFLKSQAFEYQCTHKVGKEGSKNISNAIKYGIINHTKLAVEENMWYTSIPTVFPTTKEENTEINGFTNLSSNGKFSQSKGKTNLFVSIIASGYAGEGTSNRAETIATVSQSWGANRVTEIRQEAWEGLLEFYNSLNK